MPATLPAAFWKPTQLPVALGPATICGIANNPGYELPLMMQYTNSETIEPRSGNSTMPAMQNMATAWLAPMTPLYTSVLLRPRRIQWSWSRPMPSALSAFSRYAHEAIHAIEPIENPRALTR